MSTPSADAALSHFVSALDTCLRQEKQLEKQVLHLADQRTRLIAATRCAIATLDPEERNWWRNQLRALIGPEASRTPAAIGSTTDRMRLVRLWLRDEAPDPFRNANLKDALARHGHEVKHSQIGTILTRLAERGEITRLGLGTYRANLDHPALEAAT